MPQGQTNTRRVHRSSVQNPEGFRRINLKQLGSLRVSDPRNFCLLFLAFLRLLIFNRHRIVTIHFVSEHVRTGQRWRYSTLLFQEPVQGQIILCPGLLGLLGFESNAMCMTAYAGMEIKRSLENSDCRLAQVAQQVGTFGTFSQFQTNSFGNPAITKIFYTQGTTSRPGRGLRFRPPGVH